jgi:hypothetical protein
MGGAWPELSHSSPTKNLLQPSAINRIRNVSSWDPHAFYRPEALLRLSSGEAKPTSRIVRTLVTLALHYLLLIFVVQTSASVFVN